MSVHPISQEIIEPEVNNNICEAYGCNKPAINRITVNVGKHRNIDLIVCQSCTPKFEDRNVNEGNVNEPRNHDRKSTISCTARLKKQCNSQARYVDVGPIREEHTRIVI